MCWLKCAVSHRLYKDLDVQERDFCMCTELQNVSVVSWCCLFLLSSQSELVVHPRVQSMEDLMGRVV